MINTYRSPENHRLPLLVKLVLTGCDNCITNYNSKHHLAPYLEKINNLFQMLELVKKEWRSIPMDCETHRNYILNAVCLKEMKLTEFKDSLPGLKGKN